MREIQEQTQRTQAIQKSELILMELSEPIGLRLFNSVGEVFPALSCRGLGEEFRIVWQQAYKKRRIEYENSIRELIKFDLDLQLPIVFKLPDVDIRTIIG